MSKQLDHKPQTSDSRTEQHPPELLDHSTRDTAIDERSALARLTRFVLVHRRLVIAGWLVVLSRALPARRTCLVACSSTSRFPANRAMRRLRRSSALTETAASSRRRSRL